MSQTPLICRLAPQPPRSSSPPSVLRFSVFVWSILGWRDSSSPFWLYPFVLSAADLCFFLSLGPSHCLCSLYFRQIRPAVLHRSLCLLFIVRPSIWVIALFLRFFCCCCKWTLSFLLMFCLRPVAVCRGSLCVTVLVWMYFSLSDVLAQQPLFHLARSNFGEHHRERDKWPDH